MTVEREVDDWLDGLAGRPGESDAAVEGKRIRQAVDRVNDKLTGRPVSWQEVTRRSGAYSRPAANGPWRLVGGALALVVCAVVGLQLHFSPEVDSQIRGSASSSAVWLVEDPQRAAAELALALGKARAKVQAEEIAQGVRLSIVCEDPTCQDSANALLEPGKVGLDGQGRLTLEIRHRP